MVTVTLCTQKCMKSRPRHVASRNCESIKNINKSDKYEVFKLVDLILSSELWPSLWQFNVTLQLKLCHPARGTRGRVLDHQTLCVVVTFGPHRSSSSCYRYQEYTILPLLLYYNNFAIVMVVIIRSSSTSFDLEASLDPRAQQSQSVPANGNESQWNAEVSCVVGGGDLSLTPHHLSSLPMTRSFRTCKDFKTRGQACGTVT